MTDIEIQREAKLENINKIIEKFNIDDKYVEQYGKYKAKISNSIMKEFEKKKDGKNSLYFFRRAIYGSAQSGPGKCIFVAGFIDFSTEKRDNYWS